jgi:hypothetical protein
VLQTINSEDARQASQIDRLIVSFAAMVGVGASFNNAQIHGSSAVGESCRK